jgi:hypothetical protein
VAAAWFAGLIAANVLLPEQAVRVGGATASLLGLHVPPATQVLQVAVAALLIGAAAGGSWAASVPGIEASPRAVAIAGPMVALIVLVGSQSDGRPLFERRPVETTCLGADPTWCVATSYVPAVEILQARTGAVLREIDAIGAPRPQRIVQGRAGRTTVEEILHGDPVLLPTAVVYAWLDGDCTVHASSPLLEDLTRWTAYVEDRLAGHRAVATGPERQEFQAASARIAACEQG